MSHSQRVTKNRVMCKTPRSGSHFLWIDTVITRQEALGDHRNDRMKVRQNCNLWLTSGQLTVSVGVGRDEAPPPHTHILRAHLQSLSGCFWGCEQTIIWLRSRTGRKKERFYWMVALRGGEQLWKLYLIIFLSGFLILFTQTIHVILTRPNWETAGPELCTSYFCLYVCMLVRD